MSKQWLFNTAGLGLMSIFMACSQNIIKTEEVTASPVLSKQWVTSQRLNRRTCPNTQCGSVGQLFFREGTSIYEEKDGWVRITRYYDASCGNGVSTYIDSGNKNCTIQNGIDEGEFAEWVHKKYLSSVRPEDPAKNVSANYSLVRGSDDFIQYKDAFLKATESLIENNQCTSSDFEEMGGWIKSMQEKDKPVYFTYCGGITLQNKIYLNAATSRIY